MYTIVGFKYLNFNDESGKPVTGYKIHLLSTVDDADLDEGQTAVNRFFSSRSIEGTVELGAVCDFKITLSGNTPKISGLVIQNN